MTSTAEKPVQLPDAENADAFAERLFSSALGAMELLSVYLGDHLGWYDALAADGPLTSAGLARRAGTDERYTREWLEQQASFGILTTDPSLPPEERTFALPEGAREVLTDRSSLAFLGPIGRLVVAPARRMPELLEAYRTGGGVSWDQLGDDARTAQADINRPWFEHRLADALASAPGLHEVLSRPGARIAEVGFGGGWASIALARAYPQARVDGYEVDGPSVEMARRNAAEAGVDDRVSFHLVDGADIAERDTFDAAFAFECVHDMAQPVSVLDALRRAVKADGAVVVMDEAVGERFSAPGDDLERFMYGCSILVCLPDGRSHSPSEATGTVMRPGILEGYARRAGFDRVEVLPIEEFSFFRFYRLHH
ncbi:class I SAM-dependent methyltransferase [Nocardioides caldifontis]|uniref:class I SAM-dependent methyltransferase n=1 Tax=Nocardioides caldifontis TaxID=2588938 RepID=UPI0011DF7FC2|nr:methyltransferase domain-containing protein [Nocardioides caldifontis]